MVEISDKEKIGVLQGVFCIKRQHLQTAENVKYSNATENMKTSHNPSLQRYCIYEQYMYHAKKINHLLSFLERLYCDLTDSQF